MFHKMFADIIEFVSSSIQLFHKIRMLQFYRVLLRDCNCIYYLPLFYVNSKLILKIGKHTTSASHGPVLQTVKK